MKKLLHIFAFIQMSILGCAQNQTYDEKLDKLYNKTVPLINADSVPEGAAFLDTRELEEFEVSHIPGATFTGYKDFNTDSLKHLSKSDTIVVYCSVGYRSERIGEKLQKMGFSNVYNLYGGIFSWKNSGKSVENSDGEETEQVHTYNKAWSKWLTRGEKVY